MNTLSTLHPPSRLSPPSIQENRRLTAPPLTKEKGQRTRKEFPVMVSLTVLRKRDETDRFERLRHDDARTAIPTPEADALAADLKPRIAGEVRFDKGTRAL